MLVEIQWVQAIVQGGALGGLVYLLLWFTRVYIPDSRKEREAEREAAAAERAAQGAQREAVAAIYAANSQAQRTDYIASLREIEQRHAAENDECRKERKEQSRFSQAEREADRNSRHELLATVQRMMLELKSQSPDGNRPLDGDDRPR